MYYSGGGQISVLSGLSSTIGKQPQNGNQGRVSHERCLDILASSSTDLPIRDLNVASYEMQIGGWEKSRQSPRAALNPGSCQAGAFPGNLKLQSLRSASRS